MKKNKSLTVLEKPRSARLYFAEHRKDFYIDGVITGVYKSGRLKFEFNDPKMAGKSYRNVLPTSVEYKDAAIQEASR